MDNQAYNYCLDFSNFYEARSAKIKPICSFLQVSDMNQRTSDSNTSLLVNEEVSQQDKRTAREMGGEMSSQAYLEDLKWPTKNLSKQQQQKPSILDQTQAQERMCANRSGCGMHRSYHPGDYLAQQPHQCQKYKNLNQSPAKKQQTSRDPQQQQPQHQCLEQRSQTPSMPSQCLQTSYPKLHQEQAQRHDSPKNKSSIRASSKEPSNTASGQPYSCSSNTDEENLADKRDERDQNKSNKYMEFVPQHYSHQQQHPHEQYRTAFRQNSPQRNQSQKKAPISKTKDVLSPCPHQYSPLKLNKLSKKTDVTDFDQYIKELDKNASYKYKEYAPKLGQSPPHLHKHRQEHYQMYSTSRQKVEKQQLYPIHLQQQSYPNPCENTCEKPSQRNQSEMQAKDIPLSTPHQYGDLPVPDKWGREIGGELLAKTRTRSDTSEKNREDSTVKQKKYNKCGRCSVENGTDSTSTGSSGNELCSIVRDELCALVRNESEIQSVFGELSDTVICHVKDFLCGLSTTDNVPPDEYMKESVSTKAPKNSAIDDVLDTKRQESYQTQKKASPIKGILKAQKVQMPQNPGLDRKKVAELQSVLQNPTQRMYQDLTKEKRQESYRQASQHSHRTSKLKGQKNPQQKHPNQQIADFPPFSRFGDTPEDDSEECNFGVDKKARNKFMECYGKGFPKDKPKHRQSGAGHEVFSMASSSSVSTSISAKSGHELRAMILDEMQLQSVRGDQTSRPRYKDLEEKVSTLSDLNPPRDDTHPCSNVSKFQDMKETMSTPIGSLPNLAIAVHAPTTESFKGSTTDEMPQIEGSMSVADLVSYKVITPMIMKIRKRCMTHMQNEMHLLKYLETVPRLVGQIYMDNITMEQRKL
ncbi:uncharacterized protein LOC117188935 [Drosophila miranda]|uniref:uncharacterized protein LOC117188935 n=1 Tax=Drosophila miranda TaxID=7229 RepID=UPI00143F9C18|nr:uncharacterized protein LOC117188935 [Drosophila miranda]